MPAIGEKRFTVAAVDLGIKAMTPHRMAERGCEVHVLPADRHGRARSSRSTRTACSSPTAPATRPTADGAVEALRGVLDAGMPFFGICFGNQLFGRALGLGTYKLRYGHRGVNQPVQDRRPARSRSPRTTTASPSTRRSTGPSTRRTAAAEVSHVGLNDDVVEGLRLLDRPRLQRAVPPRGRRRARTTPRTCSTSFWS